MHEPADRFQWEGVNPFVDAFEEAQSGNGPVDLADFLPEPGHPLFAAVLCELVHVDLEYGWMRGAPVPLEDYIARFPSLRDDATLFGLAAFEECRLRRQAGEIPQSDDYEPPIRHREAELAPDVIARMTDANSGRGARSDIFYGSPSLRSGYGRAARRRVARH